MGRIDLTIGQRFYNIQKEQTFTRNNCGADSTGSSIPVVVAAGTYVSAISQADADAQAVNYLNANGQAVANLEGVCNQTTFWNTVQSQNFTPVCAENFEGTPYTVTIPAHTYSSTVSQADANNIALGILASTGQATANAQGSCVQVLFPNQQQSQAFFRNNCGEGYTTSNEVIYTVPAGAYLATSTAIANGLALNNIAANGQNYANNPANGGICVGDISIINYELNENNTPYIDIDLRLAIPGQPELGIFTDEAGIGSINTARIGDTVTVKLSSSLTNPWPSGLNHPRAKLIVMNNGVQVHDSGYVNSQSELLASFTFTIGYGDQWYILGYSENTAFSAMPFKWVPDLEESYCEIAYSADETGVVMVDIFNTDATFSFVAAIETVGITGIDTAHQLNNFVDVGSTPANAWMLASDPIAQPTLKHRFAFNLAKLMNFYTGIEVFTFKVKAKHAGGSIAIGGQYSYKGADQGTMIMSGSEGSYIPSTSGANSLGLTAFTGRTVAGGGSATFDPNNVAEFLTFTYNRTSKLLTLS